jgi:hypothetical protein
VIVHFCHPYFCCVTRYKIAFPNCHNNNYPTVHIFAQDTLATKLEIIKKYEKKSKKMSNAKKIGLKIILAAQL